MKIVLINAEEAGMPEEMQGHCLQLLEWRIKKVFSEVPEPGAEVDILYSEKDPLMESEEVDENAYSIYFTVENVELEDGADFDQATVELSLAF